MEPGKEILKFEKSIKGMWKRLIESFRDTTVRKNIEKTAFFNISPHPRTQNLCVFAIRRASFSHEQISESKDTRMISPANLAKLWFVEITACRNYGTSKLRYVLNHILSKNRDWIVEIRARFCQIVERADRAIISTTHNFDMSK